VQCNFIYLFIFQANGYYATEPQLFLEHSALTACFTSIFIVQEITTLQNFQ